MIPGQTLEVLFVTESIVIIILYYNVNNMQIASTGMIIILKKMNKYSHSKPFRSSLFLGIR